MRFRLAAVAALAVLGTTVVPADAAPVRTLTVRGGRNAYVDVTFPARFKLYRDDFDGRTPSITTRGSYAGVYVAPLRDVGENPGAGTLLLAGLPVWQEWALGFGTGDYLPAGRYRVHLVTDGTTTVKIPVAGLSRDLTLSPTRRSRSVARLVHRTAGGVGAPVDRTLLPVHVRAATTTVLASAQESPAGVGADQSICLRLPGNARPCELGGGSGGHFTAVGTPGGHGTGSAMFVYPGDHPVGETDAEYLDVTAGVPGGMYAFALTIE